MRVIDWRELYAQNRAAIAKAGLRVPDPASTTALPRSSPLPAIGRDQLRAATRGHGGLVGLPRRHEPDLRLRGRDEARGARRALVHVPRGLDASVPAAVVCMLHGCTQDASTFAAATAMNDTADRHGFLVVYPEQARPRNAQGCWNWFSPENQQRGSGEPELIAGIVRDLLAPEAGQTIDPTRVYVAGLSSGGAMALILAACYPDLFAAVAVHSGLPYRSAHDVASAFAVMRSAGAPDVEAMYAAMGARARPLPSLVIHGTADRTVAPANARGILAQSMAANRLAAPQTCAHDGGRPSESQRARTVGGLSYVDSRWIDARGALMHESIEVEGLGHAWSGGVPGGSYTDPRGPSATEAIWAFFSCAGRAPT